MSSKTLTSSIYKLLPDWLKISYFKLRGSRPWTRGYFTFKFKYIEKVINDGATMRKFQNLESLPKDYGYGIDSRVVEYPWVLSRISPSAGNILDAGSTLNFEEILEYKVFKNKKIIIVNLNPESDCFWQKGISYVFGDIRNLPFKDDCFDEIICISTLEHVGMNNALYTKNSEYREERTSDYEKALLELKRVLKKDGRLFLTVPFGKYQNFGWFQQFDLKLVNRILEVFEPKECEVNYYKYTKNGWNISHEPACRDCQCFDAFKTKYFNKHSTLDFDKDMAASSRAVACLKIIK